MERFPYPSTGLDHLDKLLTRLQYGDNVVWQVDDIAHYKELVVPYVNRAIVEHRKVIYIRFAQHTPLLEPQRGLTIVELDADTGFETFSTQVHQVISQQGKGAFYVFDSLSDLLTTWATDLMVGNFFSVTCPFLYELDTLAYFALLRDRHSFQTVARIRGTTQLLLDVYHLEGTRYIHPLKVWNRHSHTMFLPHRDDQNQFTPVINSVDSARLFSYISDIARSRTRRKLDYWDQLFLNAENLEDRYSDSSEYTQATPEYSQTIDTICRIMVGREERMLELLKSHFSLRDLLDIKARLIGTGYIGGKAVGMLLARKILCADASFDWVRHLEQHDSFYVGSDIFHTYVVQNGLWKLRMEQKTPDGYFSKSETLAQGLLKGRFSNEIREQFQEMMEYFGQSPIIVRSSSLLEDSFGNAFAGKYESLFLVNQGSPEERYEKFEAAVRQVYASTMSRDALTYRLQRGLDQMDEQMALLVQRVSGTHHDKYFFPDVAGVGISYNTFVWNKELDPKAGMLRVVAGLGTRAVDRTDDDYPRLIALDAPFMRPHLSKGNERQFSQHYMDILNIEDNRYETLSIRQYLAHDSDWNVDLLATEDQDAVMRMKQLGLDFGRQVIFTFDPLLEKTEFVAVMRRLLGTLGQVYDYPVDIEFTINFSDGLTPQINLLQCRPLQASGVGRKVSLPEELLPERTLIQTQGSFMGGSISQAVNKVIYVDPSAYIQLSQQEKYEVARFIGKLNNQFCNKKTDFTMLMGPGRWGTSTPSLGVPVRFSEINQMAALCEISYPGGNLMPELSYGSHFFMDLVEGQTYYIALFCEKSDIVFQTGLLLRRANMLTQILPEAEKYSDAVFVYEIKDDILMLEADVFSQKLVCYFNPVRSERS
ncbi:MAG: phosphoenolpyruvate synthase [Planctomycetota bacterium]|nr:MAG: phosphoenolpyruvate synthase [Planctomycetota bacterium]